MKILYFGDVMGSAGQEVLLHYLPELKEQYEPDVVVAQGENLSNGRGMKLDDVRRLQQAGVDFFTGGNWTPFDDAIRPQLENPAEPIIGPANFEAYTGPSAKFLEKNGKKIMFVSLLGQTVGKPLPGVGNPLTMIDEILDEELAKRTPDAIIVNFHGDYSSEKRIIGYYLDGKVSAIVGDHWHVPTADAMILPNGTAHITDVGMCGNLHSSLGVSLDSVIPRWKDNVQTKNELDQSKPWQLNAVLIETKSASKSDSITQIQKLLN
ncbi:YmdB family metallophosphoesterase [Candidatus Saccharibacteria bacterium]|nr:YmdB family metallophosphoesterase [Candidatus Saccharibacteria bacterium]MCB9820960.1 YmdB family metallophosphoesterase [Candidatus Nomurabacteria bacterium]